MILKDNISVKDFQRLHFAMGWKYLDSRAVKKALKNSMFVIGAVENNEVIGMARLVGDFATHGLIADVIVLPEYQKRGIGKAMVLRLIEKSQELANKYDEFLIELLPTSGNDAFYAKCGFKINPEVMAGAYLWLKNEKIYIKGSKKYYMRLQDAPFESIKRGEKKIEMRLFDEKRQKLKEGDIIIFVKTSNEDEMIRTRIKVLHKFNSFKELYQNFDKRLLGYKIHEEANPKDMAKYYSEEEQQKYGVVGIEIELI